MSERANTHCYIGRTKQPTTRHPQVGTVVCVTVDDDTMAKDNAKSVAEWLRDGLTIERVPVWWVRLHFGTTEVYRGEAPPDA